MTHNKDNHQRRVISYLLHELLRSVPFSRICATYWRRAAKAEADILHPKYQELVEAVIADGVVTPAEREQLDRLANALHLAPDESAALYRDSAERLVRATMDRAIEDRRLTSSERNEFVLLAGRLGVNTEIDDATHATLERYHLLWRIEVGDLPTISVPINLQRGETCHLWGEANWHELRTRTERVGYSGASVSIPIMKGVRYRVGSYNVQRVTREELVPIDVGRFYVTSKLVDL